VSAYGLNLAPVKYVNNALGDRSDNASFWKQGYPAILAIEDYYGDSNPYYHTANDRLAGADLDYYTEYVKAAVGTFAHMTGCLIPSTPTPTATATTASTIHVGDLDNSLPSVIEGSWRATVTITVHDANHCPAQGAAVIGSWSDGYTGGAACMTDANGQCSASSGDIANKQSNLMLTVNNVTKPGTTYEPSANHDPDGESNGTSITVTGPAVVYLPLVRQ
jgi:hypothetical protein